MPAKAGINLFTTKRTKGLHEGHELKKNFFRLKKDFLRFTMDNYRERKNLSDFVSFVLNK